ncbi:glutamyl-tRNA reductase [Magnetococcales bacterium HHB-1]
MKIAIIGLSHKTAPVELRERFALSPGAYPEQLEKFASLESILESVILSTCNRSEFYFCTHNSDQGVAEVITWLSQISQISKEKLRPHLYTHIGEAAIQHGFRVAASLESQIVGEPQILGQVKEAYLIAQKKKTVALWLNKFFHKAFQVAKRIRSETTIAENAVSISYAAVQLAQKIFGDLNGLCCLLIGAGEMCELAARHLVNQGIGRVLVANRTLANAETLAAQFKGKAYALDQLDSILNQADIVISSTGAQAPIVTEKMVKRALKKRRQTPMFLIDIAVPRDIDPKINDVESAFLYDIDDLSQIVEDNRAERKKAALEAQKIILEESQRFIHWQKGLNVVPTIVDLREKLDRLREQEVKKLLKAWPQHTAEDQKRVEKLARALVNKILHLPLSDLKKRATEENGACYIDATRHLFKLDDTPSNAKR